MTVAASVQAPRAALGFDYTKLVLYAFAAVLVMLIVLPMSWLVYYAFTDKGSFTLENFGRLVSDPTFLEPLITTFILATSTSLICCIVAAPMGWLVARTDMPLRRTVRLMVTASFVTPPFLGAIAWELLAAPNSGLLNKQIAWQLQISEKTVKMHRALLLERLGVGSSAEAIRIAVEAGI